MEDRKLPNGIAIIVLGIFGYLCCCFAGFGIIPSGIAFFMAQKSEKLYTKNPELYDNMSQIKTGKIVALIALILNALVLANLLYTILTGGWDELNEKFMEGWNEGMEESGY